MANYNKVILAGNLTRDPQLSYTQTGTPVCQFGLAVNRRWRDQSGNLQDDTCFVDVTAFGRQAETINQYMSKGRQILVDGRLSYSQWTTPDGSKRSKLNVVVENFQFLGAPGAGGAARGTGEPTGAGRSRGGPPEDSTAAEGAQGAPADDVPF
jgi:single-strand DNA-binding protein